jgi:hypothetical protein
VDAPAVLARTRPKEHRVQRLPSVTRLRVGDPRRWRSQSGRAVSVPEGQGGDNACSVHERRNDTLPT